MKSVRVLPLFFIVFLWATFSQAALVQKPYEKNLRRWTRDKEVYQREDIHASLKWYATYQSPQFIEARVAETARLYEYTESEKQKLLADELKKTDNSTVFYVSFYAYNYKYADIADEHNDWKLVLQVNGVSYLPVKFEKIPRVSPLEQVLYPYSNIWSRHYYIYFPKVDSQDQPLQLHITGPLGHDILTWK